MQVELRFFATFRAAVGAKTVEREFPDGATVGEVLATLEDEYDDLEGQLLDDAGEVRERLSVLHDGREVVHLDGADTTLADGDALSVFPPVAGGATERRAFRGISLRLAKHYLGNLGGEVVAEDEDGATVEADGWRADLSAETVTAAGSMQLTEVRVAFIADDEAVLEDVVDRFAQKAMRAGG